MKLKSMVMLLGSILGAAASVVYWYSTSCVSAECETSSNLVSIILYGIFIGLFVADLISQGMDRKEA
ncbi:MAG: hypothetical protein POELPBGB_03243 [Bacteroidia bacterium]|nr:hypothetical protein [Bacteroidia bacterium]